MRSSDTDADQGKGRSSKTPNLGTWVQSMRERVLRCTSVCAHALEGPAWMQQFGFVAGRAYFLLSSSLSSPSWVSQLSPVSLSLVLESLHLPGSQCWAYVGTEGTSLGWGPHGSG